jgi:hypothetical protein
MKLTVAKKECLTLDGKSHFIIRQKKMFVMINSLHIMSKIRKRIFGSSPSMGYGGAVYDKK